MKPNLCIDSPLLSKATRKNHPLKAALYIAALCTALAVPAQAQDCGSTTCPTVKSAHVQQRTVEFDVAEDFSRFAFDNDLLLENGLPGYGNSFVTQGYIYPYGTLNGNNGVNPDGSPEFPDKVIGRWFCRGWHVGREGALTTSGPAVITHQLYDLGDAPGNQSLATDGLELADVGVPVQRAITGGTGKYRKAAGEATQRFLGFNASNGVSLRFEITVEQR